MQNAKEYRAEARNLCWKSQQKALKKYLYEAVAKHLGHITKFIHVQFNKLFIVTKNITF